MSAQLTQRDSLDAEPELAPQEPPPWVIRSDSLAVNCGVSLRLADRYCNAIAGNG